MGGDDYNKTLSGRRAKAAYGLLIQDKSIWDGLYSHPFQGDNWQTKGVVQRMRDHLGDSAPQARLDLFAAYMADICPITLKKDDFLGRGIAGGKADYQGCSEFNPVHLLSKSDSATLSKADRDAQNSSNRRVIIYLFCPAVLLNPNLWPCPNQAVLSFDDDTTISLSLMPEIPPVEDVKGLQIRLRNLGYHPGPMDGKLGPKTQEALTDFQQKSNLKVTGKPNPETNAELVQRYGS